MKIIVKELGENYKWKPIKEYGVINEIDGRATFNQLVAVNLESTKPIQIIWFDDAETYGKFTIY